MKKNSLFSIFKISNFPGILYSFTLDRPTWGLFLGGLFFSVLDLNLTLKWFSCLFLALIVEFYISNVSSEWKTYQNAKLVRRFLKKDIEKYQLKEIQIDSLRGILGDDLINYVEGFLNFKKKWFHKIRPNSDIPVIDTFKIFSLKNRPFFANPTAFAASSTGLSLVFLKHPIDLLSKPIQKFFLLHELGHLTHIENLFDQKRAIERSLTTIIASVIILCFCNNDYIYLVFIFLFFRIGNVYSSPYKAKNEAHNDFFAYKNLSNEEFDVVYSILEEKWTKQLKAKKDRDTLPISKEIEIEARMKLLKDFKEKPEIRDYVHLGEGEGCISSWMGGGFCFIMGKFLVYDIKIIYVLVILIIIMFAVNRTLRSKTLEHNNKITQMIKFATAEF